MPSADTFQVAPQTQSQQTPLMKQYWNIKSLHPDKLLFFRMGDFYEMFHEDALKAAPLLGITLTSRNKNLSDSIPMCGVPHHSIAKPINKLLSLGHRVAICDQLEDPKFAKGIVKRGVTRVLSPGVVYDADTLDAYTPNFLVAYCAEALSFLDITTGDAFYYETSVVFQRDHLISLLNPVEIVLSKEQKKQNHYKDQNLTCTVHETSLSHISSTGISSNDRLLSYIVGMQGKRTLSTIRPFEKRYFLQKMKISSLTREHLELFSTYKGDKKGSFFHCINKTKSPLGARKLRSWVTFPLMSKAQILERQKEVQKWKNSTYLTDLRKALSYIGDLERKIGKTTISYCHPRDIFQLAGSLSHSLKVLSLADNENHNVSIFKPIVLTAQSIKERILKTLKEEIPLQIKDGNFIRQGISQRLDELKSFIENAHTQILEIQDKERKKLNIPNLKVRHNNIFGYYIEVTHTHKNKVPSNYIRKQTLVNAERYITEELQILEARLSSAKSKSLEIEKEIFNELRIKILDVSSDLLFLSDQISRIDAFSSLAWLALENNYVRPEISNNDICLIGSRHPVVEHQASFNTINEFVPNNIILKRSECFLITGPNMAGKSTLMRQVALNAIMMQMGCFVPASKAKLPLFDQIQTRIGASDILSEGLSTFMLEMKETAQILNESTSQTLIILDEIGRGTSTFDGMSLAQAILEYLVSHTRATTFFATHYHELTKMADKYPHIINKHMKILEDKDLEQITFLYQLVDGFASKSYGIHVAKLAGIPSSVIERAKHLLEMHTLPESNNLKPNCLKDDFKNDINSDMLSIPTSQAISKSSQKTIDY